MEIKHAKTSTKPAGSDASLIQGPDWNASHTFGFAATRRIAARTSTGAGAAEEVTLSEVLDWISSSDGSMLARFGGTWGAPTGIGVHGGDLVHLAGTPTTPDAGRVKSHCVTFSGRQMLGFTSPDGIVAIVQPHIGRAHVMSAQPIAGSNNQTNIGMSALLFTGTATARTPTNTNLFTSIRRMGIVSAATTGAIASARSAVQQFWRGNAAGLGGFHVIWRFGIADASFVANGRTFAGLWASTGAPTDVNPSTLTNILGVGTNAGDTELQLYAAGNAAQSRISLGANFPANTVSTDFYELALYCPPGALEVRYQVTRLNTGHSAIGTITDSARLPSTTTFLAPYLWRSNDGTASAVAIDWSSLHAETEV